jgi:dodecin
VPSQLDCAHSIIASGRENAMSDSVYKVIEIVGTSSKSWEAAAATAVERASQTLRDLRVAEVAEQDVQIKDGKIELYRTKLKLSFKFEGST